MFQFRLLSLVLVVTLAAILFAFWPSDAATIAQLRRDLGIDKNHSITILHRVDADQLVAVASDTHQYKLFVCYRGFWDSKTAQWEIPFAVGSGAPPGEPEAVFEYARVFDHFPTDAEVARFRESFGAF